MTAQFGLRHGLISPLRIFGLFDIHFIKKGNYADSYEFGMIVGCLLIFVIGGGVVRGSEGEGEKTPIPYFFLT